MARATPYPRATCAGDATRSCRMPRHLRPNCSHDPSLETSGPGNGYSGKTTKLLSRGPRGWNGEQPLRRHSGPGIASCRPSLRSKAKRAIAGPVRRSASMWWEFVGESALVYRRMWYAVGTRQREYAPTVRAAAPPWRRPVAHVQGPAGAVDIAAIAVLTHAHGRRSRSRCHFT
jgi:hypothetical protein